MDAAERLFAERGFDGCTLRDVAEKAKVNQGMIHYFFKSKETLFREAYVRRGQDIVEDRLRLLDAEEALTGQKAIAVERLVELFLRPAIDLAKSGPGGRAFFRMQARLQLESSKFGDEMRKALYDESSSRFVAAFARSLPGLRHEDVCWRFVFILGTYQYVLADTGRLEVISDGRCTSREFESAFQQMVRFLADGMRGVPVAA
ncbi:hypothetical protein A9762_03465 [Pandoraea sp. ISTKB]|nr:hypothetical protein A9762_03465 [Pandoraea sp. ISTKB]